eukprot:1103964-Prorocentrum_minimum.AAC.1
MTPAPPLAPPRRRHHPARVPAPPQGHPARRAEAIVVGGGPYRAPPPGGGGEGVPVTQVTDGRLRCPPRRAGGSERASRAQVRWSHYPRRTWYAANRPFVELLC